MEEQKLEHCADAIVVCPSNRRDGKHPPSLVLVCRRTFPEGPALPGGRVEPGESARECIVREVKEETGCEIEVLKELGIYADPGRDPRGPKSSTVFLCKTTRLRLFNSEPWKTVPILIPLSEEKIDQLQREKAFAFDHYKILKEHLPEVLKVAKNL